MCRQNAFNPNFQDIPISLEASKTYKDLNLASDLSSDLKQVVKWGKTWLVSQILLFKVEIIITSIFLQHINIDKMTKSIKILLIL